MENKQQKKENIVRYLVYATAAYFGLQLMMGSNRAKAATVSPAREASPPPLAPSPAEVIPPSVSTPPYIPPRASKKAPKAASGQTWIPEQFPLRKGMQGPKVKALQLKLGLTADGKFGNDTQTALLKKYAAVVVPEILYQSITQPATGYFDRLLEPPKPGSTKDSSAVLRQGSSGPQVYRLQKWLGFKDKQAARKGEAVADSKFGPKTVAALQQRTGLREISLDRLQQLTTGSGMKGLAGDWLMTRCSTTIYDTGLRPHRTVPAHTILGKRTLELKDPTEQKAYTQFKSIDGFNRWVVTDAI